jgi:hypothetical protein
MVLPETDGPAMCAPARTESIRPFHSPQTRFAR